MNIQDYENIKESLSKYDKDLLMQSSSGLDTNFRDLNSPNTRKIRLTYQNIFSSDDRLSCDFAWNGKGVITIPNRFCRSGGHPGLTEQGVTYCAGRIDVDCFFFHSGHFRPKARNIIPFWIEFIDQSLAILPTMIKKERLLTELFETMTFKLYFDNSIETSITTFTTLCKTMLEQGKYEHPRFRSFDESPLGVREAGRSAPIAIVPSRKSGRTHHSSRPSILESKAVRMSRNRGFHQGHVTSTIETYDRESSIKDIFYRVFNASRNEYLKFNIVGSPRGFFHYHGRAGINQVNSIWEYIQTHNEEMSDDQMIALISTYFNGQRYTNPQITQKIRSNPHSFISYFLNSLKDISAPIYSILLRGLEQSDITDFTIKNTHTDQLRREALRRLKIGERLANLSPGSY